MRIDHWKLLPGFWLGLLVMLATAWAVGMGLGAWPVLRKMHWGLWLVLTLVFPVLALYIHGRERRSLYPLSYLVNAAGAGCAFGIALGFLEVPVAGRFPELMLSAAIPALTAAVMCLLYTLWRRTRWIAVGFTILVIPAILGCLLFGRGHGIVALGGVFGLLFFAALPISCGKVLSSGEHWLEQLSLSGFGAYLIVVVGAIVVLLEDGPDGIFEGLFEGIADVGDGIANTDRRNRHR